MTKLKDNQASRKSKKTRIFRFLLDAALIIGVLVAATLWMQRGMVSGVAPDFDKVTIAGEEVSLERYQGKPLLIHFWASWCAYCNFEQSSISAIAKDWQVLTVAFKSGKTADVSDFLEEKGIQQWPVIVDDQGRLAQSYGVRGVPAAYIIDSDGNIRFKMAGLTSKWGIQLRLWLTKTLFK